MDGLDSEPREDAGGRGCRRSRAERSQHYYRRLAAGEQGMLPESEIEPVEEVADADELPAGGRGGARPGDRAQAQRRARHQHGHDRPKSLIEARDGPDVPRHDRRGRCWPARAHGRAPAAGADEQLPHARRRRWRRSRHPELEADVPLDFVQGKVPKLRADDLSPVEWPADPEPGVGAARPRRPLHVARRLGDARRAARARLRVRLRVELGQPRRRARSAHPALVRARASCRSRWRSRTRTEADRKGGHLARRAGRRADAARDGADPRGRPAAFQDVARHRYFNTNTLWVEPAGAAERAGRARRRARPADDRQPQDRRPADALAGGDPARDARWARRSACSRAPRRDARPARALRAGQDDQRPARRCARTRTR